jgi:hypothetical protein
VAVGVLLSGVSSPLAHAADAANPEGAFNVVVSPTSVGLQAKPGTAVSTDLKVQNQGLSTEHVKVSLMKFSARGQDGTPQLEDITSSDDFANWAQFSTPRFDAEPNVWKTVKMTINVPKTAAYGYYYAVIFSREGAEKQIQPKQANLLGAVASLVLLDVDAPGSVRQAKIAEFSTGRKVQEFLPADFVVRMQNTGNTHVAPRGNIVVTKGGKNVALLEVNLKKGFVLPNSYRKFTSTWSDGKPVYKLKEADGKAVLNKQGKQEQALDWSNFSPDKLRFGKYDAKLVMVYDDGKGDVSTEATLSFWVIPWRILGGGLIVALLVVAGLWATVIRPVRRRLTKSRGYGQPR